MSTCRRKTGPDCNQEPESVSTSALKPGTRAGAASTLSRNAPSSLGMSYSMSPNSQDYPPRAPLTKNCSYPRFHSRESPLLQTSHKNHRIQTLTLNPPTTTAKTSPSHQTLNCHTCPLMNPAVQAGIQPESTTTSFTTHFSGHAHHQTLIRTLMGAQQ